jgi:hypothetical protein
MDITLEDVKIAIKILEEFERRYREANRILRRLGVHSERGYGGFSPESIMRYMFESGMVKGISQQPSTEVSTQPTEEEPISEEELNRLRSLKEKIRERESRE